MALREDQLLAQIDDRQLLPVGEHLLEGAGKRQIQVMCPGRSAARAKAKWCAADPGPSRSVAVPDQRCTAISAFTRVLNALWRCTASGTRGLREHEDQGLSTVL